MEVRIDGVEELLRRIIREELEVHHGSGGWLNARQAAEYISVSVPQLHNLVSAGKLPRYGDKGQRIRLRRADLDRYIEGRRRR